MPKIKEMRSKLSIRYAPELGKIYPDRDLEGRVRALHQNLDVVKKINSKRRNKSRKSIGNPESLSNHFLPSVTITVKNKFGNTKSFHDNQADNSYERNPSPL